MAPGVSAARTCSASAPENLIFCVCSLLPVPGLGRFHPAPQRAYPACAACYAFIDPALLSPRSGLPAWHV